MPHMVVVPLSTLRNWERELATWAPHLSVVVLAGNELSRQARACARGPGPGAGRPPARGSESRAPPLPSKLAAENH